MASYTEDDDLVCNCGISSYESPLTQDDSYISEEPSDCISEEPSDYISGEDVDDRDCCSRVSELTDSCGRWNYGVPPFDIDDVIRHSNLVMKDVTIGNTLVRVERSFVSSIEGEFDTVEKLIELVGGHIRNPVVFSGNTYKLHDLVLHSTDTNLCVMGRIVCPLCKSRRRDMKLGGMHQVCALATMDTTNNNNTVMFNAIFNSYYDVIREFVKNDGEFSEDHFNMAYASEDPVVFPMLYPVIRPSDVRNIHYMYSRNSPESSVRHLNDQKCIPISEISNYATEEKYFFMVKDLHKQGGEIDDMVLLSVIKTGNLENFKYAYMNSNHGIDILGCALSEGQLNIAKYALEMGYQWNQDCTTLCYDMNTLESIKFLNENGGKLSNTCIDNLYRRCSLEALMYVNENIAPTNTANLNTLISYLYLEKVKYFISIGVPWGHTSMKYIPSYGSFETVKYLHINGCPWHSSITTCLYVNKDIKGLKYVLKHGCPWDPCLTLSEDCTYRSMLKLLKYVISKGCPVHPFTIPNIVYKYSNNIYAKDALKYLISISDVRHPEELYAFHTRNLRFESFISD